jgi:dihydrofolate reductase
MRQLVYSMGVSLDGFIAGPDGDIGWSRPDEELHRFHNEQARATGVELYGRRLYEAMRYWETAGEQNPAAPEHEHEFERVWKDTPKLVVSRTLESVGPEYELVRGDLAERVAELKEQPGGAIAVGGAGLAASLLALGLVDELRPLVHPVVLGAGTPFLPALDTPLALRLAETRTFGSGVVSLRYEIVADV